SDYYDPRLETGTVYFQTRTYGGYVKLKVYDKIHQLLDENPQLKSFLEGKKHTRYEFTISKGASLDDYARPDSVFWHYMPCDVLKRPESLSVAPWKPSERIEYDDVSVNPVTDYQRLKFLLEDSSVLRMLVEQVSSVNGGASLLHRTIDSLLSQNGDTPL
ncbi:MAG: hypothetical protein V2I33_25310, partial [Kangiellaceae bacterium]|nr:hypothetical protein [Kangiellaceae bacterium]